ncbi:transcriptional regulator, arac family [hydrocarbon metagenome]|uniref:Transcriptional regulator, arac family n=1 Tax=hydrocarbon metagenome TaxID=938273 RepID=A0A0W8E4I8_9ZZZZ
MNTPIDDKKALIERSFQLAFDNDSLLFQIVDLFPMPIEIFAPDGTTVFVNRAFLEEYNISGPDQIVGKYNLLKDPVVNDELGLREYLLRAFEGETLSASDVKVPFKDMSSRYNTRNEDFDVEALYKDINSFPIWDGNNNIAYIVNVFVTTRMYQGRSDIAKAKEYIETHWLEEFDMDKVAQLVNLSRYHFSRLFKKHTSMTPFSYYQEIKIKKLKEALCDKNLSITEAFAACGEDYKGNYLKIFKEKTGMTPSQYRKTAAQE